MHVSLLRAVADTLPPWGPNEPSVTKQERKAVAHQRYGKVSLKIQPSRPQGFTVISSCFQQDTNGSASAGKMVGMSCLALGAHQAHATTHNLWCSLMHATIGWEEFLFLDRTKMTEVTSDAPKSPPTVTRMAGSAQSCGKSYHYS